MQKFYVHSGKNQQLIMAHTPIQAAYLVCKHWLATEVDEIDGSIIVSEKGFDKHEDDFVFHIYDIVMMIRKNNLYNKRRRNNVSE